MSTFLIILLVLALVALSAVAGFVLFIRFLTSDSEADARMGFNPFGERPHSPWFIEFFQRWRKRHRQLTYRRDRHGRFRRHDR